MSWLLEFLPTTLMQILQIVSGLRNSVYHYKQITGTKSNRYVISVIVAGRVVFLYAKIYNVNTNLNPYGLVYLSQINSALTSKYHPPITVSAPMMEATIASTLKTNTTTALQVTSDGKVEIASRDEHTTLNYLEGFVSWGIKSQ